MRVRKIERPGPIFLIRSLMKSKCQPTIAFALHSGEEAGHELIAYAVTQRGERVRRRRHFHHRTRVIISLSVGRSVGRPAVRVFPFRHAHAAATAASEACSAWTNGWLSIIAPANDSFSKPESPCKNIDLEAEKQGNEIFAFASVSEHQIDVFQG